MLIRGKYSKIGVLYKNSIVTTKSAFIVVYFLFI
jgi:hypothetical protein